MACDHNWERTGMFLMKHAPTHNAGGDVSGTQVVGGLQGFYRHQTPEVEWCDQCGLLRIPPPAPDQEEAHA